MPEERSMTKSASAPLPATDRALPADPAMERAVLSAMLREPIPCVDIALSQFGRNPEVFHSQVHREVFAAILALADHPRKQVDVVAVAHQLQTAGKLEEIGGEVFLAELYGAVATTVNLESWCVTLRELFTLRRMIAVCSEAMLRCFDPAANAPRLLEEVESAVYNIRNAENKSNCAEIRDCIVDQFKYLQDVLDGKIEVGISTGYAQLDAYTGGLKPGETQHHPQHGPADPHPPPAQSRVLQSGNDDGTDCPASAVHRGGTFRNRLLEQDLPARRHEQADPGDQRLPGCPDLH